MKSDQKTIEIKMDGKWRALFEKAQKTTCLTPLGEGWRTRAYFQASFGLSLESTKKRLQTLGKQGLVERFSGSEIANGTKKTQVWYRIKKGKK